MITVKDKNGRTDRIEMGKTFQILDNGTLVIYKDQYFTREATVKAYALGMWQDAVIQQDEVIDQLDMDLLEKHDGPLYVTYHEFSEIRRRATVDTIIKNGDATYLWNNRPLIVSNPLLTEELIFRSKTLSAATE